MFIIILSSIYNSGPVFALKSIKTLIEDNMTIEIAEHIYRKEDVEKAYDMGLENAILVLEKSIGLSAKGQREMLNMLKRIRNENRLKPFFRKNFATGQPFSSS